MRTHSPAWLAVLGATAIGAGALSACVPFGQSTAGDLALPFDAGDDAGAPDAGLDGGNGSLDGGVEAPGGAAPPEDAGA